MTVCNFPRMIENAEIKLLTEHGDAAKDGLFRASLPDASKLSQLPTLSQPGRAGDGF